MPVQVPVPSAEVPAYMEEQSTILVEGLRYLSPTLKRKPSDIRMFFIINSISSFLYMSSHHFTTIPYRVHGVSAWWLPKNERCCHLGKSR